jgi:hypothetical protein
MNGKGREKCIFSTVIGYHGYDNGGFQPLSVPVTPTDVTYCIDIIYLAVYNKMC